MPQASTIVGQYQIVYRLNGIVMLKVSPQGVPSRKPGRGQVLLSHHQYGLQQVAIQRPGEPQYGRELQDNLC